ncbi:MAG: bifunctional folylpolyglutamate synthase/dihydrofolate synthase [Candidatus Cloacimonetes bacterium]|nr:bifunctional folylpolyglutamate synthase/dihydrofolate synthase [Candidatus Cloacimonadota bacterium]
MKYQEFLDEIFAKTAIDRKFELTHISKFLNAVGNPEKKLRAVHIAGTNGKGSTAAAVESILHAHNLKVGLNTSPHLVNYQERFRINKKEVQPTKIKNLYEQYRDLHNKFDTTYFEISTSIAFQLFLQEKVDYAIMEVGLGGRLDASVLVNSVITAITNIDYEHTKTLGNTLPKIAKEKAGILKTSVPVVLGKMRPTPQNTIIKEAKKKDCPIINFQKEVDISNIKFNEYYGVYDLNIPKCNINYKNIKCNLVGRHQIDNTALAILIIAELFQNDVRKLQEEKVRQGLNNIIWNGRLQKICDNPKIVIDGAHNSDGIKFLVYNLKHIYKYKKLITVIGVLYDKDFKSMIKQLSAIVDLFVICKSHFHRAAGTEILSKEVEKYKKDYILENDINLALVKAKEFADKDDLICVTGSLYTIGEVMKSVSNVKAG